MSLAGSVDMGAHAVTGVLQSLSEQGSKRAQLETAKDKRVLTTFVALSKQGWRLAPKGKGSPTGEGVHLRGVGLMIPPAKEDKSLETWKTLTQIGKNIALTAKARRVPTPKVDRIQVLRNGKWYWGLLNKSDGSVQATNEQAPPPNKPSDNIAIHNPKTGDWAKTTWERAQGFVKGMYGVKWAYGRPKAEPTIPFGERRTPANVQLYLAQVQADSPDKRVNKATVEAMNRTGKMSRVGFEVIEHEFNKRGWGQDIKEKFPWLERDKMYVYEVRQKGEGPNLFSIARQLEDVYGISIIDAIAIVEDKLGRIKLSGKTINLAPGSKGTLSITQYNAIIAEGWTDEQIIADGWRIPE